MTVVHSMILTLALILLFHSCGLAAHTESLSMLPEGIETWEKIKQVVF